MVYKIKHTLIALFLDLDLLREILLFLPANLCTERTIICVVARPIDLRPVKIGLLEHGILEILVWREEKGELEAELIRTAQIGDLNIGKMFESLCVAVGDELADTKVIAQHGKPEGIDRRSCGRIGR